jgi:putative oxidoreductase
MTHRQRSLARLIVSLLVALIMVAAGAQKLLGTAQMITLYEQIGLGQGLRFITAAIEICCAVALFIPPLRFLAALGLTCTMIGALAAHLFLPISGSPTLAIVLVGVCSALTWDLRPGQSNLTASGS